LLPKRGEVSIFDRSWYGRVLVERVDNLTPHKRWQRAYKEISQFEKLLINDGVIVIKLFLSISKDEQLKRFKERIENPKKRWKITSEDILNRQNWDSYQQAFEDMLDKTDGKKNPWHIVAANNKRYARINAMKHFAKRLNAHIDTEQVELLKPEVEKLATKYLP
ncbi:polyphosphate kinase 2 family protein, partial [Oleiphilus sp. HI0125]